MFRYFLQVQVRVTVIENIRLESNNKGVFLVTPCAVLQAEIH